MLLLLSDGGDGVWLFYCNVLSVKRTFNGYYGLPSVSTSGNSLFRDKVYDK